jgi:hypothetical protein
MASFSATALLAAPQTAAQCWLTIELLELMAKALCPGFFFHV